MFDLEGHDRFHLQLEHLQVVTCSGNCLAQSAELSFIQQGGNQPVLLLQVGRKAVGLARNRQIEMLTGLKARGMVNT